MRAPSPTFSQATLNVGFIAALIMAAGAFAMGGFHLSTFMTKSSDSIGNLWKTVGETKETTARLTPNEMQMAITSQVAVARLGLLSCGIFVGMAFGFLGFSLFLIGVRDEMEVDAQSRSQTLKLVRLAPGVFVILCSAILIGVCATDSKTMKWENTASIPVTGATQGNPATAAPKEPLPPGASGRAGSIAEMRQGLDALTKRAPATHKDPPK